MKSTDQLMLSIGVEGSSMACVEKRRILHDPHGRFDRVDRRAALAENRPAGPQRTGEIGAGLGPFGFGHLGLRQGAAAAVDGESKCHEIKIPLR